jgi:hypothetical protein
LKGYPSKGNLKKHLRLHLVDKFNVTENQMAMNLNKYKGKSDHQLPSSGLETKSKDNQSLPTSPFNIRSTTPETTDLLYRKIFASQSSKSPFFEGLKKSGNINL